MLDLAQTEYSIAFFFQIPFLSHVSSRVRSGFAAEVHLLSVSFSPLSLIMIIISV